MRVFKNFPDDEKLQAAVVIPSYDEGANILETIDAWRIQMQLYEVRAALFVVVNNSRKSSREVKDSNKTTFDLLKSLVEKDVKRFKNLPKGRRQVFGKLREDIRQDTKFRMALIDLWSSGNAPEQCNVGLARDTGARVACEYLQDDGFLISSDADTIPSRTYLCDAEAGLKALPDVSALKGGVTLDVPKGDLETAERISLFEVIQHLERQMRSFVLLQEFQKKERRKFPHLAGSNAVIRKSAYESAGGFPHIRGAEDTELSRNILRQGGKIYQARYALEVKTSVRVSERAEAGHALGQAIKNADDHVEAPWNARVYSLTACRLMERLLEALATTNAQFPFHKKTWQLGVAHFLVRCGEYELTADHLERLWNANQIDPTLVDVHFNRILEVEVERIAAEIYEKMPLRVALAEFRSFLKYREQQRALIAACIEEHFSSLDPSEDISTYLGSIIHELHDFDRYLSALKKKVDLPEKPVLSKPETVSEPFEYFAEFMLMIYFFMRRFHLLTR